MATVSDTKDTLALFEGREVLDPNTIKFEEWVAILESTVSRLSPKYLNGFQVAMDIVKDPDRPILRLKFPCRYTAPPARVWLGHPGGSWEFEWHFQYLVCGMRVSTAVVDDVEITTQQYLLFGKSSKFYVLTTTWEFHGDCYRFSNNTRDGHLQVRECAYEGVVKWCLEDKKRGVYFFRELLERLCEVARETENDLTGKLGRATWQRQMLERRLSTISWVEPGHEVWVVEHYYSDIRKTHNFYPVKRTVVSVRDGMAYLVEDEPRRLRDCFRTESECSAVCPESFTES